MLTRRELKRLAKRSVKQSGRRKQRHLSNAELVNRNGLGAYARFVPLTPQQEEKTETFIRLHLSLCRQGTREETSWLTVISGLMEGYLISKFAFDEVGRHDYRRQFESAARLWDAAYLHMQETGNALTANLDAIGEAIDVMCAMKKQMRRDELCAVIDVLRDNFDRHLVLMLGREPKSLSVVLGDKK